MHRGAAVEVHADTGVARRNRPFNKQILCIDDAVSVLTIRHLTALRMVMLPPSGCTEFAMFYGVWRACTGRTILSSEIVFVALSACVMARADDAA